MFVNSGLKVIYIKVIGKHSIFRAFYILDIFYILYIQRIPESGCARKKIVDIDNLVTSRPIPCNNIDYSSTDNLVSNSNFESEKE